MTAITEDSFFANDEEDTHCMQACYQMVVARLTHKKLTTEQAEIETGYEPQRLTWQFAMLLSLANDHGAYVRDFEDFDPEEFATDPIAAIRAQIEDEDAVRHQIENSNLRAEANRARACIDHPNISFHSGAPTFNQLVEVVDYGAQVICLVNGAILLDRSDYRPHFVVIRSISELGVEIDDPGPPAMPKWTISKEKFLESWLSPNAGVANYLACSMKPLPNIE